MGAQGCDRHLYALFCVWQKYVNEMDSDRSSNGYSSPLEGSSEKDINSPVGSPGKDSVGHMDGVEVKPTRERGDSTTSRARDNAPPLPLIFADSGWDRLNNTVLSTSNCGNPSLRHFGFGPTSGDGFGIGYIIKDETISICVSSKHRQTRRFIDTLESYLLEIRRILRITQRRGTSPKASRVREASATRPKPASRLKSRGRVIKAHEPGKKTPGTMTPADESAAVSDDEGLGGYGFFDAGMLLQALKARGEGMDDGSTKPSERATVNARRREIGKKLRLSEY